jgi:hypothetical protein
VRRGLRLPAQQHPARRELSPQRARPSPRKTRARPTAWRPHPGARLPRWRIGAVRGIQRGGVAHLTPASPLRIVRLHHYTSRAAHCGELDPAPARADEQAQPGIAATPPPRRWQRPRQQISSWHCAHHRALRRAAHASADLAGYSAEAGCSDGISCDDGLGRVWRWLGDPMASHA